MRVFWFSFICALIPIAYERPADANPDLIVDEEAVSHSLEVTQESYSTDDCAMIEKCIRKPGMRTLLRFEGTVINIGSSALDLGSPVDNPDFEYSACHAHYHHRNVMLYELLKNDKPVVVAGDTIVARKQGFCLVDKYEAQARASVGQYTCEYQGLSPGWADDYDSSLDCQWLDITGVAPGQYTLRVTVNPDGVLPESNRANNIARVPVTIEPR